MDFLYIELDDKLPRFGCDSCNKCNSLVGTSLCDVKNRGCCWYFPKFTLFEIQRMSKTLQGMETLNKILKNSGTTVYKYYLHAKGFFDEKKYEDYMNSGNIIETEEVKDHTIFFRVCPFVKEGVGCTIPSKFRSYICNFFLCNEVINSLSQPELYETYKKERDSYIRWINYENQGLELLLKEQNLNLIDNFEQSLEVLRNTPYEDYEFPMLSKIHIHSGFLKDA